MNDENTLKPSIILIEPQMGENIGAAARAMMNCDLTDLRIVNPRDGWPNERANAMASGAFDKMPPVSVFDTTQDAVADLQYILATTARPRDMVKDVLTARDAATTLAEKQTAGVKTGILFGGERAGLGNDDVALANGIITIPMNPDFSSINLGQAVLLVAYEYYQAVLGTVPKTSAASSDIAPHAEMTILHDRLEQELENHNFFKTEELRPTVMRNLKSMLARKDMTSQEVKTFHGVISALIGNKKKDQ